MANVNKTSASNRLLSLLDKTYIAELNKELVTCDEKSYNTIEKIIEDRVTAIMTSLSNSEGKRKNDLSENHDVGLLDIKSPDPSSNANRVFSLCNANFFKELTDELSAVPDTDFETLYKKIHKRATLVMYCLNDCYKKRLEGDDGFVFMPPEKKAKTEQESFKAHYDTVQARIKEGRPLRGESKEIKRNLDANLKILADLKNNPKKLRFHKNGMIKLEKKSDSIRGVRDELHSFADAYAGFAYLGLLSNYSDDIENLNHFVSFLKFYHEINPVSPKKASEFQALLSKAIDGLKELKQEKYADNTTNQKVINHAVEELENLLRAQDVSHRPLTIRNRIESLLIRTELYVNDLKEPQQKIRYMAFCLENYFEEFFTDGNFLKKYPSVSALYNKRGLQDHFALFFACLVWMFQKTSQTNKMNSIELFCKEQIHVNEPLDLLLSRVKQLEHFQEISKHQSEEEKAILEEKEAKEKEYKRRRSNLAVNCAKVSIGVILSYLVDSTKLFILLPQTVSLAKEGALGIKRFIEKIEFFQSGSKVNADPNEGDIPRVIQHIKKENTAGVMLSGQMHDLTALFDEDYFESKEDKGS